MSRRKKKHQKKIRESRKSQPTEKRLKKEKSSFEFFTSSRRLFTNQTLDSAGISHDIIFVESGHFLTREIRNLLNIARYLQSMENGSYIFGDDIPIPSTISYTQLSKTIQGKLLERGVPVAEERPFLYPYEILGSYLPRNVRINELCNAFIELMHNEWKVIYARKLFVGFGFEDWAKGESIKDQPQIRQLLQEFKENYGTIQTGFTFKTARALWFASECIIRIRAQWDKLLKQFVLEKLLGHKKVHSLSFEQACDTLRKYRVQLETDYQKECLDALLNLADQTQKLRKWRDDDVHYFSQAVFGVLEKRKTSQSLGALWDMVVEEHNRVREGVMAAIGMVILGPQTSSTFYASQWPTPTRYVDFNNLSDVNKHNQLIEKVNTWQKLQKAIKETRLL